MWLRRLLKDISNIQKDPTPIYYDNNSNISLLKNNVFHEKRKHNDTCFHFIRGLVSDRDTIISLCGFKDHIADIFRKSVGNECI